MSEISQTELTAKLFCAIANEIDPMVQFTYDVPELNPDGKLPVLDLKVFMSPENEVLHEFYEKPTKNSRVILASSALSWSQKRTILTQEALRRIRNTSPSLGDQVVNNHLSDFMLKLKESGYNAKFRREIILSAKNAYKILVQKSNLSTQPLFRTRAQMLEDKKFKGKNATNWWKGSQIAKNPSLQFCLCPPPTPNRGLAIKILI